MFLDFFIWQTLFYFLAKLTKLIIITTIMIRNRFLIQCGIFSGIKCTLHQRASPAYMPYAYMLNNSIYVVWLLIAVLSACIWPSRLLSSTLPSSLSMVPRYRTFTPRWWSAEVRLAPSIGTAVWSRQSINYNRNDTHTSSYILCIR